MSIFTDTAARADLGTAGAAKRGRNPAYPYVPIIKYSADRWLQGYRTEQIRGRAYATRDEAIACAQQAIDRARSVLAERLAEHRNRALREQHGLPRELADVEQRDGVIAACRRPRR